MTLVNIAHQRLGSQRIDGRPLKRRRLVRWLVASQVQDVAGARSAIHLAASPEVAGLTGAYFESNGRPAVPSKAALDKGNQQRAWAVPSDLAARAPTVPRGG